MDKPKGIKVIAILILIFSGLAFISRILLILLFISVAIVGTDTLNTVLNTLSTLGYPSTLLTYFIIISIVSFILNILLIVGAIGLLKYKEWGRKMVIYTAIGVLLQSTGSFIYSISSALPLTFLSIFSFIVGVVLYGLEIFYFSKKKVKEAFK